MTKKMIKCSHARNIRTQQGLFIYFQHVTFVNVQFWYLAQSDEDLRTL